MSKVFSHVELGAMFGSLVLASFASLDGSLHDFANPLLSAMALIMVVWIAGHDFKDFTIPDGPLVCLAMVGIAVRLTGRGESLGWTALLILVDGLACGGAFWLVREGFFRLRGYDGLGFGDVKLAAAGGIFVGSLGLAWSVFLASAVGLLCALVFMLVLPRQRLDKLPFGALLAPALWLVSFFDLRLAL